jgi:hypothetical protein
LFPKVVAYTRTLAEGNFFSVLALYMPEC